MKHWILLVICISSVEILIRSNYISSINLTIKVGKQAIRTILNKSISDHWKENVIPLYSFRIIRSSLRVVSILLSILLLFIIGEYLLNGLLSFAFSSIGILETLLFALGYIYFRKKMIK